MQAPSRSLTSIGQLWLRVAAQPDLCQNFNGIFSATKKECMQLLNLYFVGKLETTVKGLLTSHSHFFSNNLQYFLFKSQPNLLFYEMKKNLWAVSHNKSREWVGSFHILTLNMETCGREWEISKPARWMKYFDEWT